MSAVTRLLLGLAEVLLPADSRARLYEEWRSDLDELCGLGSGTVGFACGLVVAAVRMRARRIRRSGVRATSLVASIALVLVGGATAIVVSSPGDCDVDHGVLAVVRGTEPVDLHRSLPARVLAATHAVRIHDADEGVWVDAHGDAFVGVYGRNWQAARSAALAVGNRPGPTITYVCQTASAQQLAAAQTSLATSSAWQHHLIGFSDIDVQHAQVTVALVDTAPNRTEADLLRRSGPHLRIERSTDPFPDLRPGRGRMPVRPRS